MIQHFSFIKQNPADLPGFLLAHGRAIFKTIIPCVCVLCHQTSRGLLCKSCHSLLPRLQDACHQCGEYFALYTKDKPVCAKCTSTAPIIQNTLAPFTYKDDLPQLINRFKFKKALYLSELLAVEMVTRLQCLPVASDLIIPVPLNNKRLKFRGFNQSLQLAKQVSQISQIPVYNNIIQRHRETGIQSGLNKSQRKRNIRGAFSILPVRKGLLSFNHSSRIEGKNILIIDDVITTGSTVRAVAKTLNKLKPKSISVLAIAKTQRK